MPVIKIKHEENSMNTSLEIQKDMFDNMGSAVFDNEFFSRFADRRSYKFLELSDSISKEYQFPTLYADVASAIGIFMCSYDRAAELVARNLHRKVKPVRLTRGRSLIIFSCYEYKHVRGIAPYNEIAMAIPVMVNTALRPPVLPMLLSSSFTHLGYCIVGMPVTSQENMIRGNKIWGLPKVTQRIDMETAGDFCVTTAYEDDGDPYLTICVPRQGKSAQLDECTYLYTRLNGKLLRSETNFKGVFNVVKHNDLLWKINARSDAPYIKIGNSPSAKILRELQIEQHPFQLRYAEHVSSCFDLPDKQEPKWLRELM
ncbi:MAG TPA: acetoacetate decarboxylase family protein [Methanoregulaceae archaeon]|nr:acetoacetate decarboxylase family protein [Methanoregulaceae archaeon]